MKQLLPLAAPPPRRSSLPLPPAQLSTTTRLVVECRVDIAPPMMTQDGAKGRKGSRQDAGSSRVPSNLSRLYTTCKILRQVVFWGIHSCLLHNCNARLGQSKIINKPSNMNISAGNAKFWISWDNNYTITKYNIYKQLLMCKIIMQLNDKSRYFIFTC